MTIYGDLTAVRGLLFDIDGTLYDSDAYIASHKQSLVERLAMELGRSYDDMREEVRRTEDRLAEQRGRRPSLANTFLEYGIGMGQNVTWRSTLLKPERYLSRDPRLAETLAGLRERYRIAALTNNPSDIASRTLDALGVREHVPVVVALDDTFVSKPDLAPFHAGLAALRLPAAEVAMVGDRYDVDIAPARELGMAGVLVDGVADVYALPHTLGLTE